MSSWGQSLDFIYIDSSVDEAAGGHAAIRFGQTVFHFQHTDEGFFLLVKDSWDAFRYLYNDLQNRTLAVATLPLTAEAYQIIKNHFLTRYLIQQKRFSVLRHLQKEETFYEGLQSGKGTVSITGLGLFAPDTQNDTEAHRLKEHIEARLGFFFLEDLQQRLEQQLRHCRIHLQPEPINSIAQNPSLPTLSMSSSIRLYFDLLALHEAVAVLAESRPVLPSRYLRVSEDLGRLSEAESMRLEHYRSKILQSLLNLLISPNPANSGTIFLQTARYQALSQSITNKYLSTLDPFSDAPDSVNVESLENAYISIPQATLANSASTGDSGIVDFSKRSYFEQLRMERRADARTSREFFFTSEEDENIAYNQIESSFARLQELELAGKSKGRMRIENGSLLPCKSHLVEKDASQFPMVANAYQIAKTNREMMMKQLLEVYDYNLFEKNCVTELFQTVYSAFTNDEQAAHELGGYLRPGEYFSFVPFRSFDLMQQYFPISSVDILPSLRKRWIESVRHRQGLLALLQESNTLTSTIYNTWEEDTPFLFFTDDAFLMRPFYGVVNLAYAAISSAGGVCTFPVDGGTLLKRSFRGMVFSLPELTFVNIRKGTFPAVAGGQ